MIDNLINQMVETDATDSYKNRWEEKIVTCPQCHGAGECDYLVTKLISQRTISPPYERDVCGKCVHTGKVVVYICRFCLVKVTELNFSGPETECDCGDLDQFLESVKRKELPR